VQRRDSNSSVNTSTHANTPLTNSSNLNNILRNADTEKMENYESKYSDAVMKPKRRVETYIISNFRRDSIKDFN
jgi:hypothetical protein